MLYVDSYFWAGHAVLMHDGKTEAVHSHNFCATAKLTSETLNEKAMVIDFCGLRQILDRITDGIARSGNIGRIDYFAENGQTTEVMAKYIFEELKKLLPDGIALAEVIVTEEPRCRAAYSD